jgi:pyruvate dehydrogenase E2 component (dihydrolipoamide acetyltransferase)
MSDPSPPPPPPAPPTLHDVIGSYGEVETQALSRIQMFTAKAMTRNWTTIPHVTHQDLMDVTALEAHRRTANAARTDGVSLSPVPYLLKAIANLLQQERRFNAVLEESGKSVILRNYVNIGLAIDTPGGLVIGVVRGVDRLGLDELSAEAGRLAEKARTKGLALAEMTGGGFTISSLGAAGGTGFTPIINAPEVAILGVSRLQETPRKGANGAVEWRKMLPVALSYDHRVINGADAGRFMAGLQAQLDALAQPQP